MNYDVDTILRQQATMEGERTTFESHWLEVAERLLPRQADFLGANSNPGAKRTGRIFDETAMLAHGKGTAAFEGFLIPRASMWQSLEADMDELMKIHRVRVWFAEKTKLLFALRYAPKSGFANQIHESFMSLLAFGTQALWVDGLREPGGPPRGLHYRSLHLAEIFIMEDFQGRVDRVNRKFTLEARQAVQKWPDNPPECALKAMRDRKEGERHEYIHALFPRDDFDPERLDGKGMPIGSKYISVKDRYEIEESGFRTMPLIVSRFEKSPREPYGRSPGMQVLPAVKAANEIMRSLTRATQMAVEPPLLIPDDGVITTVAMSPRGVTPGGVTERGERLVQPLFDGSDTSAGAALLEMTRKVINEAFYVTLFQVLTETKSHVSATEIMERSQEKGMLLAPVMGRQETELLSPMTDREVDLMAQMGYLDDMPPELVEAGGAYRIRYENPLARAQRAEQGAGFYRTIEGITPLANIDKSVLQVFNLERATRGLADINAVPPDWMNGEEELAEKRKADAQQAQLENLLAAAPVVGKVANDLSQVERNINAA